MPTHKPPAPDAPDLKKKPQNDPESVVYLGLNNDSRGRETAAFKGQKNATMLTGSGDDQSMQGKIASKDPEKGALDLTKPEGVAQFLSESGAADVRKDQEGNPIETEEEAQARVQNLSNVFLGYTDDKGEHHEGLDPSMRDEMAGLIQHLQKVESGDQKMDRLVISGHSYGDSVFGSEGEVSFNQIGAIMNQFPNAQNGVEDLMLSACHTLEKKYNTQGGGQYKDMFPNLQSVWAYNGTSPSVDQGSMHHMRDWLGASQGDNPAKLKAAATRHKGQNAKLLTGSEIGAKAAPPK